MIKLHDVICTWFFMSSLIICCQPKGLRTVLLVPKLGQIIQSAKSFQKLFGILLVIELKQILFFCGTFHNIFKFGTPYQFLHRYQWKKLQKPLQRIKCIFQSLKTRFTYIKKKNDFYRMVYFFRFFKSTYIA